MNSNSIAATQSPSQPRSSTSSNDMSTVTPSRKQPSRPPLATDDYMRSASPARSVDQSPIDRLGGVGAPYDVRRGTERAPGLPSSLPDSSPLSSVPPIQSEGIERANSELGHYPDLQEQQQHPSRSAAQPQRHHSPERHRQRDVYEGRQANNYSTTNLQSATLDRAPSPEKPTVDSTRVKISGPMNGAPIPTGFKFGGKDPSSDGNSSADRREKAKSRSFWGFGKGAGGKCCIPDTYLYTNLTIDVREQGTGHNQLWLHERCLRCR
jgi:RalA-binding protein 1